MQFAPDRRNKAKSGEDHEHRSAELPDPSGKDVVHESPRADTGGKRCKSGPNPSCIGPFGSEQSAVARKDRAPVGAVGQLIGALLDRLGAALDLSRFVPELVLFTFHRPSDARAALRFRSLQASWSRRSGCRGGVTWKM